MKFYRSLVKENTPIAFEETFDFSNHDFSKDYPLLGVLEAKGSGEIYRHSKGIAVYLKAKAKVLLSDARTCEKIQRTLCYEDEFDLIESPNDEEGEGYLFPENEIDLDEVYFCSLRTHVPYNATDAKELSKGGEGYRIYSSDDELPPDEKPSLFDQLDDFEGDDGYPV